LPEDQASAIAFKTNGSLIVGTQCHGLALFNRNAKGEYKHIKNIVAPERFGPDNCSPVPLTPKGTGLPSNLINDILVTQNGSDSENPTIWIATNAGIVKANASLSKLEYWRGRDYANKVRGLYGDAPKDWQECSQEIMETLLIEDYLTCLSEDEHGVIGIGTRQNGLMIIAPKTGKQDFNNPRQKGLPDNYITKLLPMSNGDYLIGFYGGGVVKMIKPFHPVAQKPVKKTATQVKPQYSVAQNNFPKLPSPIKPPTAEEIRAMHYELKKKKPEKNSPKIVALNDDWRTQGNWIDRYGRHSAILCAQAGGGLNFEGGYFLYELQSRAWIGRNYKEKNDQLRRWVHWLESNDRRVLQCLQLGGRKQAD
jgi:hypothetical protein